MKQLAWNNLITGSPGTNTTPARGTTLRITVTNHPPIGRFMSPDPLEGSLDNPQSWNRYTYALDNPTNVVDPLGLRDCLGPHGEVIHNCPDPGPKPEPPGQPDGPSTDPNGLAAITPDPFQPIGHRTVNNPWTPLPSHVPSIALVPSHTPNNCIVRDPTKLDFFTPRTYAGGVTEPPIDHITRLHILPSPGKSQYIFQPNVTTLADQQGLVLAVNTLVFQRGAMTTQPNGNAAFNYTFPVYYDPSSKTVYAGIGFDRSTGRPTNEATFVTQSNCQTVVTGFPGRPNQPNP